MKFLILNFKKISKYNKSKDLYDKVVCDFKLVNDLILKEDLLNATTILRTLYENIIYIIVTAYDKTFKVTLNTLPKDLKPKLKENCDLIFTNYFESDDFENIYKYLCKIVHPCSLKELVSYMSKTIKYKNYLLNNLKYMIIMIEYMYLNFLNKKIKNEDNGFNLNLIDLCTYINLVNISYYINDVNKNQSFIKKYMYCDTDNKYVLKNQKDLEELYELLIDKEDLIEVDIKELTNTLDKQINDSKYKKIVSEILNNK